MRPAPRGLAEETEGDLLLAATRQTPAGDTLEQVDLTRRGLNIVIEPVIKQAPFLRIVGVEPLLIWRDAGIGHDPEVGKIPFQCEITHSIKARPAYDLLQVPSPVIVNGIGI